ncbi:MAG: fibronectin type III domain-containing protein [bacterium]
MKTFQARNLRFKYFIFPVAVAALLAISLTILFSCAQVASATVSAGQSSTGTTGQAASKTITFNHTSSGADPILIVGVSMVGNQPALSVTFNNIPLTRIAAANSGSQTRASMWYLLNPPAGTYPVTVNLKNPTRFVAGATTYSGINYQNPFSQPLIASGDSTIASMAVPGSSDQLLINLIARRRSNTALPLISDPNQTVAWMADAHIVNGTRVVGASAYRAGAPDAGFTWTWAVDRPWAMISLALNGIPSSSDTTPPLRSNLLPSGTILAGTVQTAISLNTDENATCRYSEQSGSAFSSMTLFTSTGGLSHSTTVVNLTDGNTYSYYVKCSDQAGNINTIDSIISFSIESIPVDSIPPTIPSGLIAGSIGTDSVDLSWTASTDNESSVTYKVFQDGLHAYTTTDTSITITGLSDNTTYQFSVSAFDESGNESLRSDPLSVTTEVIVPPDTTPPTTPSNLQASNIESSSLNLTWDASSDASGVSHYIVYLNGIPTAQATFQSYTITGLIPETEYTIRIRAVDNNGNESALSDPLVISTLPSLSSDTSPPTTPMILNASASSFETIQLSWTESIDAEGTVSEYKIYANGIHVLSRSNTNGTIDGLQENTTYILQVSALDNSGNESSLSSPYVVTTPFEVEPDTTPPGQPNQLISVNVSKTEVSFAWSTTPPSDDIDHFLIYLNGSPIALTTGQSYTAVALTPDTEYAFQVSAVDASGNESTLSSVLSITTLPHIIPDTSPPNMYNLLPSGLLPSGTSSTLLQLTTNEPASCRADLTSGKAFASMSLPLSVTDEIQHYYSLTGLSDGQTYTYFIRCQDQSGNISDEVVLSFSVAVLIDTEPPTNPTGLSAESVGSESVSLIWEPSTDNIAISGYRVYRDGALAGITQIPSFVDLGVIPGETFVFTVTAVDPSGNESGPSNQLEISTLSVDLTFPEISGITVALQPDGSILISWNTDEPATAQVEYGFTSSYGSTSPVSGQLETEHAILLDQLSAGTTYHYRIISSDAAGNASFTEDGIFSTPASPVVDTTPPSQISDLHLVDIAPTVAIIGWTAPGDDGSMGAAFAYDIRYSSSPISSSNFSQATPVTTMTVPSQSGMQEQITITELTPSANYYFAIRSIDEQNNESELSNILFAKTPTDIVENAYPGPVADLIAIAGKRQVTLHWTSPTDPDLAGIRIVRNQFYFPTSPIDGEIRFDQIGNEFIDTGLVPSTKYYYSLYAYDTSMQFSEPVMVVLRTLSSGSSIVSFAATPSSGAVVVRPEGATVEEILIPEDEIVEVLEVPVDLEEIQGLIDRPSEIPEVVVPSAPSNIFLFEKDLYFGMKDPDVARLQEMLAKNPSIYPEGLVTGYYGPLTLAAVKRFQCAFGFRCGDLANLDGYGKTGPLTRAILNRFILSPPSSFGSDVITRPLIIGTAGADVRMLQKLLSEYPDLYPEARVTGYYGELTSNAIARLQCLSGIACSIADDRGYWLVGPRTRAYINLRIIYNVALK